MTGLLWHLCFQQTANQLVEGFRGSPVLLLAVSGQLQCHDGHVEAHPLSEGPGLILDQLRRAAFAHQQGIRLETIHGLAHMPLHEFGGVATQVAGLERGVGDGRSLPPPLDHREQEIGVGVALRCMEHVVHALHRCRDAHGPHMGRAFVGPECELHDSGVHRQIRGHRLQPRMNQFATAQRPGEQLRKVTGLVDAVNRTEHQLNRPFGGDSLCLQRIGQTHAADHEIGATVADAIQLQLDVLTFHDWGPLGQESQLFGHLLPVQVRRSDLDQFHAALPLQKSGQGQLQLGLG